VPHLSEFERAELKFFFADVRRRRRHDERKRRVWKLLPDSKIFRRDSEPPKSEHVSTRFSHSSDLCPGDLVGGQSSPFPTFSPSSSSFVALQLPFSPMRVFARRIKHPLDVPIECPHHSNARHHGGAIELDDQEQGLDRGLPFLKMLLDLGKLLDVFGGVLERNELATARQGNGIVEGAKPISHDAIIRGIGSSLKIGQVNLVHLLFLLCASGFRARLVSHFAWSLTRPPFVLQRRRIGTALSFSTPIESFEQTRACRSGLQDSIARGARRIYRNASWRRAGPASWR
jgi:hypothetical protein